MNIDKIALMRLAADLTEQARIALTPNMNMNVKATFGDFLHYLLAEYENINLGNQKSELAR